MKCLFRFLYYPASFYLIVIIFVCQCKLLRATGNGFANILNVLYDFDLTRNIMRFVNFTCNFVDVSVYVSYLTQNLKSMVVSKAF